MKAILWVSKNNQGDHFVEDFFLEDGAYKEPDKPTDFSSWMGEGWELTGSAIYTTEKETTVVLLSRS